MLFFERNKAVCQKPYLSKFLLVIIACSLSSFAISETKTGYEVTSIFSVNKKVFKNPVTNNLQETHDERLTVYAVNFPQPPRDRVGMMWGYGNPEGRVRASLDTHVNRREDDGFEVRHPQQINIQGEKTYPYFSNSLVWVKSYVKGDDNAKITATILPGIFMVHAPLLPRDTDLNPPKGNMSFRITVNGSGKMDDGLELTRDQSTTRTTSLSFHLLYEGSSVFPNLSFSNNIVGKSSYDIFPDETSVTTLESETRDIGFIPASTYRYNTNTSVKHNIDLSHIKKGEVYTIRYYINVSGGTYTDQFVWAYFADPLDSTGDNSGVLIETTDAPSEVGFTACAEAFDNNRYQINADATVTDRYTALTWQRCPVYYSLDDNATTDNISDDSCVADDSVDSSYDWQMALQLAGTNTLAGQSDWRLPNIKELESLVAECGDPAIEPEVFPDTPTDSGFWSSTSGRFLWQQSNEPAAISEDAWQVMSNGNLQTTNKTELAYGRLVRDSGTDPIVPLTAIYAGRSSIEEGDSGSSIMQIPVVLAKAADTDVSVDYAVTASNEVNVINGTDFDETSGRLTFLPGETRKLVDVTVYGNIDSDDNKYLDLTLSNPSANSRIAVEIALSIIYDDDPVISFGNSVVQAYEGGSDLRIPVHLDKPAAQPITVDYQLAVGSADFSDISGATNGTLTINTGSSSADIVVGLADDAVIENDETITVELSNPVGAKLQPGSGDTLEQTAVILDDDHAGTYSALNDTGLTECVTDSLNAQACPQAGFAGQDAELGRDADSASNDPVDGVAGFSFTKLDTNGSGLADNASSWSCVNDNITGLIWESKTTSGLHDQAATYSWYNSTGINDGGYAGVNNGGACSDTGNCDTEKFVAAVNAEALCGYSDWRLPTISELFTLVNLSDFSGDLDLADGGFFPYSQLSSSSGPKGPWSSSTVAGGRDEGSEAWYLTESGIAEKDKGLLRTTPLPVRLVRGGIYPPQ